MGIEFLAALRGHETLEEAAAAVKQGTRRYAKRQMTWFSAKPYVTWVWADTEEGVMRPFDDILAEALTIAGERGAVHE